MLTIKLYDSCTVKPHTEWHGTLPVYPMVDPYVRLSGPLHKGPNAKFRVNRWCTMSLCVRFYGTETEYGTGYVNCNELSKVKIWFSKNFYKNKIFFSKNFLKVFKNCAKVPGSIFETLWVVHKVYLYKTRTIIHIKMKIILVISHAFKLFCTYQHIL